MKLSNIIIALTLFINAIHAAHSGVTLQFYYYRPGSSCTRFPVAFDWWAGKALIGNMTSNFVGSCSIFDQSAIDSKNGRSFFYASGYQGNNFTSTISTFVHRDSSGSAIVPKMLHQANTKFLESPDALVYDAENDRLIFVDSRDGSIYALDYSTGALSRLAHMYSANWACTSPVLSNGSLYCTWDMLYQINLQTGLVSTYSMYPPLVHEYSNWIMGEGIDGVIQTDLYYIYWNPQTQQWGNFVVETPNCNKFDPFDSNQTIFSVNPSNDKDMMNSFSLFAQQPGNSSVYAAMIRGGANSFYPSYLILYALDASNNLHQVGTSPIIPTIANQNMLANGDMMWDGYTLSQNNQ